MTSNNPQPKHKIRHYLLPILIGILLLAIDLIVKLIANRLLPWEQSVPTFIPGLEWYLTHNTGYHWIIGIIPNPLIWSISGMILVGLLTWSLFHQLDKEQDRFNRFIYRLLIPLLISSSGNVVEVLFTGKATDFFVFRPLPWPSNIADQYINLVIYIVLPVVLIRALIHWLQAKRNKSHNRKDETDNINQHPNP
jgi:lipoprotein signal peptidase